MLKVGGLFSLLMPFGIYLTIWSKRLGCMECAVCDFPVKFTTKCGKCVHKRLDAEEKTIFHINRKIDLFKFPSYEDAGLK